MSRPTHADAIQAQEQRLLAAALALETEAQRRAFLACVEDPALRRRLEELIAASAEAESFFGQPPHHHAGMDTVDLGAGQTVPTPAEAVSGTRIGHYKLLEKIGEGGFGEVWMAEQREPVKRRVALKIIKPGMDSRQIVGRFEAERQALALMDHLNIARIFDGGATDTGRPYFVMELVRGVRITEYCDQHQLTTRQRLDLFIRVCQAIQHAHQKGIIHRDIKPSNILVTLHDGVPVPKVIDFGIAKATQGELSEKTVFTQFQQFIGTPAYISPEQAEMSGLDIDTRADIYSLGVLLYELLVGQTPFDAREMMQGGLDALVKIIREREPLRPSTKLNTLQGDARTTAAKRRQTDADRHVHQLRGDLDWIVMKCLEKDRTRRYETANDLAADIQRHLANEPIVARPPSVGYRLQKAWQRNKFLWSAAGVVLLTLILGTGVSLWQAIRATRANDVAVRANVLEKEQRLAAQAATREAWKEKNRADAQAEFTRWNLYAADMLLGQTALEAGNFGSSRQSIEKHRPKAGEKDLRGFEWRLLWRQSRGDQGMMLEGHSDIVRGVAFSPDGRLLASCGTDKTVIVWEVSSGRKLDAWIAHSGKINSVSFSPDGTRLATAAEDGVVKLWEWPGASLLATLPKAGGHAQFDRSQPRLFTGAGSNHRLSGESSETAVYWLKSSNLLEQVADFSALPPSFPVPGAGLAAVGSRDRPVQILDSRGQVRCILKDSKDAMALALSPTAGQVAVATGNFGTQRESDIRVHDTATGQLLRTLTNHGDRVWCLDYSPDGQWLASASSDQTVRVWDAHTLAEVKQFRGHGSEVRTVAFSPDSQSLASAGKDQTVRIWRWVTAPEATRIPGAVVNYGYTDPPLFLGRERLFAADLKQTNGRQSAVWNVLDGRLRHEFPAGEVCLGEDMQDRIVTFNPAPAPKLSFWDARDFSRIREIPIASTNVIRHAALSPDRKTVVLSFPERVGVADCDTGRIRQEIPLPGMSQIITRVFPDNRLLAAMTPKQKDVRLLVVGETTDAVKLAGDRSAVYGLSVSPKEAMMATASIDGTLRLWEAPAGRELAVLGGHTSGIFGCAFSPDGRTLVSASGDTTAKLWHVATQREMMTLAHDKPVTVCAFSPEGNYLATGTIDGQYHLWHAASWEAIATTERLNQELKAQNDAVPVRTPSDDTAAGKAFRVVGATHSPAFRLKLQEEEVREMRSQPNANGKSETFIAMGNLAYAYHAAGRAEEAVQLQEETLAIRRQVRGPEYPSTIEAMSYLATYYHAAKRKADALKLREEILQLRRKVNGPGHATTRAAMKALADSYASAGRKEEADALRQQAAELKPKP